MVLDTPVPAASFMLTGRPRLSFCQLVLLPFQSAPEIEAGRVLSRKEAVLSILRHFASGLSIDELMAGLALLNHFPKRVTLRRQVIKLKHEGAVNVHWGHVQISQNA